jgi:hypothetical protein
MIEDVGSVMGVFAYIGMCIFVAWSKARDVAFTVRNYLHVHETQHQSDAVVQFPRSNTCMDVPCNNLTISAC